MTTDVAAPISDVWRQVSDISSHTGWMQDALAIRFTSATTAGLGTTFDCDTRIGPLSLTDRMTVTEWQEGKAIGIRHRGVVTGTGRFTLTELGTGHTRFTWDETLRFPWWLGGTLMGLVASPVLRRVWRGNLARLRGLIEGPH